MASLHRASSTSALAIAPSSFPHPAASVSSARSLALSWKRSCSPLLVALSSSSSSSATPLSCAVSSTPHASQATEVSGEVENLNSQYGNKGVAVQSGEGGLTKVALSSPDGSGGLPHSFPQFDPGAIQKHRFARNVPWEIASAQSDDATTTLVQNLNPSDYSRNVRNYESLVTFEKQAKKQESPSLSPLGLEMQVASHAALPPIQAHKRVVLVRHGESTWNAIGRIQGSSDFAVLTPKGESQAETSRQMLLVDSFDSCFYSPLARTKRTAEIIWGPREKPMVSLFDLREIDLYSFQGLYKQEGKDRYGENYKMWQKDAANFEIDGHYPVRELWERAQSCWQSILNSDGNSILVVAHNAVNQALVATATGLGPEYFRQLLQSNCGVSVLDFTPRVSGDGPPYVCLDRLNQTPSPPLVASGGRKALTRVLLVCHGATESSLQGHFPASENENVNVLGGIQSGKVAELLLDVNVDVVLTGPQPCAKHTADYLVQVQEAADCLGVDCLPRYVDKKELSGLRDMNWGEWLGKSKESVSVRERWQDYLQHEVVPGAESLSALWERAGAAWKSVLHELGNIPASQEVDSKEEEPQERTVVVVSHPTVHIAMLGHCLGLTQACLGSFHLDTGSLSVVDFPDGASGRGIVRCLNYTAHLGRWAVPVTRPALRDEDF